ncbi:MAG: right-handed parallel beta-helix repeat-containing protein [Myxococcales bacterium]|nr:right-handed parallel beta-helix repeat-containing protein [Myxococcales bacterium]
MSLLSLLWGCVYITAQDERARYDLDGDEVPRPLDCDDDDPTRGGPTAWFADSDADTYGNPDISAQACDPPAGFVATNTDCDDTDAGSFPGAPEPCDQVDNDCDGVVDDPTCIVDATPTGSTGDTGAPPCTDPPGLTVDVTPKLLESTASSTLVATITGGGSPEIEVSWGDDTPDSPWSPLLTQVHTYQTEGIHDLVVHARTSCGEATSRVPVAVVAPGQLLLVDTPSDERDDEVFPPTGGAWKGAGLSLYEALALSQSRSGRQAIAIAAGLPPVQVGQGLPELTDDAGTWIGAAQSATLDGTKGELLILRNPSDRLLNVTLDGFDTAVRVTSGGAGAQLLSLRITGSSTGLDVRADDVLIRDGWLEGNGGDGLAQARLAGDRIRLHHTTIVDGIRDGVLVEGVDVRIEGCVVRDNARHGIRVDTDQDVATHIGDNTIANNGGSGLKLRAGRKQVDLKNTLLVFNEDFGADGSQNRFAEGAPDHNLWWGNGLGACDGCTLGPAAIESDPALADLATGDVSLLASSPAIDAGTPTSFDKNGASVGLFDGHAPDIGALEH